MDVDCFDESIADWECCFGVLETTGFHGDVQKLKQNLGFLKRQFKVHGGMG
jgi:hypothetical protein